ncbi:MAG: vitamin K epoxide reductase family protein [Bergeyella sp.]
MYNRFLNTFGYNIQSRDWNLSFQSHPNYPDITAVSETLEIFNIENIIAEVPKDLFDDLPDTFIALIIYNSKPENVFVVKTSQNVKMIFSNNVVKKTPKDQFLELWTGVLLSIDDNPRSENQEKKEFKISGNNLKYVLLSISILLFIYINFSFKNLSILSSIYCLVSLFGLGLSFLSIKESLGFQSNLVNRICSANNNSECDKIFFSRGAEVVQGVTMSDLGLIYFIFSSIASFSFFLHGVSTLLLSISVLSLPVVIYSVYYQHFKAKAWCVICLGIASSIIFQIIVLSFGSHSIIDSISFSFLIILLSGIAGIWLFIKPSFDQLGVLGFLEVDYNTITRRYDIFNSMFSTSKNIRGLNEIELIKLDHNTASQINVTIILSPTCGACGTIYREIKKMQTYYHEKIHFSLIFNIKANIEEKIKAVFMRLLEMAQAEEIENLIQGLDDWFIHKFSENKWLRKWKYPKHDHSTIMENYNTFFADNEMYNTPAILVNDTIYPMPYKLSDLKYFIKEIETLCSE